MQIRAVDSLVRRYSIEGHPLGRGLSQEEATQLIQPLRQRLQASDKELDLSSASVKRLEGKLIELHWQLQRQKIHLGDDELVQIVREIASYLGITLITHANGVWDVHESLYNTMILIPGPVHVVDGRNSYISSSPMVIVLGHIASASWELIEKGIQPVLYSTFSSAKRKVSKQNLKQTKPIKK